MRDVLAPIPYLVAALAGCMGRTAPVAYAESAPVRHDAAYHLDAGGAIAMPLIGAVPARGRTTAGLAAEISAGLHRGFIREPSVAVKIESYRPFFIIGEVAAPGQYPYGSQHDS